MPYLEVSDLQAGHILVTGDEPLANVIRFSDWNDFQGGHAALVLDVRGDLVQVLSAGFAGKYVAWNNDPAVGGRNWAVIEPRERIDAEALRRHVVGLQLGDGLLRGQEAYLRSGGSNVCSGTVAAALEAAGATPIQRRFPSLVTPADLRRFGSVLGQIDLPLVQRRP